MWKRSDLKTKAKFKFKRNYWKCVLVAIFLTIAVGSGTGSGSAASSATASGTQSTLEEAYSYKYYENKYNYEVYGSSSTNTSADELMNMLDKVLPPVVVKIISAITMFVILIFALITIIVNIFILGPLEIGGYNFFKANVYGKAEINTVILPFKKKYYWKMVRIIFLRNLYTVLWTCFFIVPGIIKTYEYKMVSFVLADCPTFSRKEAFRISKKMMKGNKWNAFVLDFSFIEWQLLSIMTCGIVGIFYLNPYRYGTYAELFVTLRENYLKK